MEEKIWNVYKYENGFVDKEYSGTYDGCKEWIRNRQNYESPRKSYFIGKDNF